MTAAPRLLHRGKKPWEDLCCMARCRRESAEQVAVRFGGGGERSVGMCAEHAPAYRELARRQDPARSAEQPDAAASRRSRAVVRAPMPGA